MNCPSLTGEDVVDALVRLGCRITRRTAGMATVHRGAASVIVPEKAMLPPPVVNAMIRTAGVDASSFLQALARD